MAKVRVDVQARARRSEAISCKRAQKAVRVVSLDDSASDANASLDAIVKSGGGVEELGKQSRSGYGRVHAPQHCVVVVACSTGLERMKVWLLREQAGRTRRTRWVLFLCCGLCWLWRRLLLMNVTRLGLAGVFVCCRYFGAEKLGKQRLLSTFQAGDSHPEAQGSYPSLQESSRHTNASFARSTGRAILLSRRATAD